MTDQIRCAETVVEPAAPIVLGVPDPSPELRAAAARYGCRVASREQVARASDK